MTAQRGFQSVDVAIRELEELGPHVWAEREAETESDARRIVAREAKEQSSTTDTLLGFLPAIPGGNDQNLWMCFG
jgi:hypothetical protein